MAQNYGDYSSELCRGRGRAARAAAGPDSAAAMPEHGRTAKRRTPNAAHHRCTGRWKGTKQNDSTGKGEDVERRFPAATRLGRTRPLLSPPFPVPRTPPPSLFPLQKLWAPSSTCALQSPPDSPGGLHRPQRSHRPGPGGTHSPLPHHLPGTPRPARGTPGRGGAAEPGRRLL